MFKESIIETLIGQMLAIASNQELYLLNFLDCGMDKEIAQIEKITQSEIKKGKNAILELIEFELNSYFKGILKVFKTPVNLSLGSLFQQKVWQQLNTIAFGETKSYLDMAKQLGDAKSCRAVGGANGANPLAIIIPCHRVINTNGKLGGYSSGLWRKQWLLHHEINGV